MTEPVFARLALIGIGLTSADTVNFATGWMVINGVERDKLIDFENYEGSGNETFIGGNEANVVTFTGGGGNVIDTGGGADTVHAGAASDTITGGTGLDMLFGEAGNDIFQIAASHIVAGETMDGGLNDDTIRALGTGIFDLRNVTLSQIENIEFGLGSGSVEFRLTAEQISSNFQTIIGNANSADTLFIDLAGKDSVSLASLGFAIWHPGDRIIISGSNNDDTIEGSIKDDTIEGGAGADNLNGGANTAVGDTLSYAGSNAGVTVFLATNSVSGGHADGDNVTGFENVTGGSGNDTLTGTSGVNVIDGDRKSVV